MLGFIDLDQRVPTGHPLRTIKALADHALAALSPEFDAMYAEIGRPSIPPESRRVGTEGVPPYRPLLGAQ
jgi:hypothetical protein